MAVDLINVVFIVILTSAAATAVVYGLAVIFFFQEYNQMNNMTFMVPFVCRFFCKLNKKLYMKIYIYIKRKSNKVDDRREWITLSLSDKIKKWKGSRYI